jgi:predicted MarR family transcription regulator
MTAPFEELSRLGEMVLRYLNSRGETVEHKEISNVLGYSTGIALARLHAKSLVRKTGSPLNHQYQITDRGRDVLTYYGKD